MPISPGLLRKVMLKHKGIFFLDEIHRGTKKQQEELMPIVWEQYLELPNGSRIHNDWLTVIGATTNPEDLVPPLFDRFVLKPKYEPYSPEEMEQMIFNMAKRDGLDLDEETAKMLATASGGNPRNARQLVEGAVALNYTSDKPPTGEQIMDLCGLTQQGLNEYHLLYLQTLENLGGRAGLSTMATIMRLHPKVISDLERTLIEQNLIQYSSAGRELMSAGYKANK
jgi:Holliday junction resolvasome RuvABC ATP-dependent DNA helicase subunit